MGGAIPLFRLHAFTTWTGTTSPFLVTIYLSIYCLVMDLQEVGVGRGDWMEVTQDRDRWRALVGTVRDFRVP